MAKSVISCGSIDNCSDFSVGDIVRDEDGSVFLVTDDKSIVVLHCTELVIGTIYPVDEWEVHLVPQGLSVTLTQE